MPWLIPVVQGGAAVGQGIAGGEAAKQQAAAADAAAEAARGDFETSLDRAQGNMRAGRRNIFEARDAALSDYAAAADRGVGAVSGGAADARRSVLGGLVGAEDALGRVQGLQRYESGATTAINPYDVTGTRSRLGELYDNGFDITTDPAYQFQKQQGEEAIASAASAGGGRVSGRALKELTKFNSDLAGQHADRAMQRRASLAGAADTSQQNLFLNQAGRTDAANLTAQANQANLAGMGFGAQGDIARARLGTGSTLGSIFTGEGAQLAGIYDTQGARSGAANIGAGNAIASNYGTMAGMNLNTGANIAGTRGASVPYAGGELASYGNMMGQFGEMAAQYGQAGMDAAGKVASGGASGMPSGVSMPSF